MTDTALPQFEALSDHHGRIAAEVLHRYLQAVHPALHVSYDGDRTVTLGPIQVRYLTRAVEIRFPDPFPEPCTDDTTDVAVYVPGQRTFAAVATVVDGLLSGWTVTS